MDDYDPDRYYHSCHSVGIGGGCGFNCPVLLRGDCENEEEMKEHDPEAWAEYFGEEVEEKPIDVSDITRDLIKEFGG